MKRQKMNLSDLIDNNIDYYGFGRFTLPNGVRGTYYKLDKPLTKEQHDFVFSFRNTSTGICTTQFAPELKNDIVFIYDKCVH